MKLKKNLLLLLTLVTFITSCVPTRARRWTTEIYPATNPSSIMIVYRFPTNRSYIELGEIQSEMAAVFDPDEEIFAKMKVEGAKWGAHVIVIVEEYRVPDRMATCGYREGKRGIAIRFK